MATIKVRKSELISRIRAKQEEMFEQRLEWERQNYGTVLERAEKRVKLAQEELADAKKHLTRVRKGSFDSEAQVRERFRDSYLERELSLLEMSEDEFIRVGTNSNWAKYL